MWENIAVCCKGASGFLASVLGSLSVLTRRQGDKIDAVPVAGVPVRIDIQTCSFTLVFFSLPPPWFFRAKAGKEGKGEARFAACICTHAHAIAFS